MPSALQQPDRGPDRARAALAILPGLLLASAVAASAYGLRRLPAMATFSPMILAILIGIAFHNLVGTPAIARPGVTFSLRRLLRLAIILLGLQLTITQVIEVGGRGIGIIAPTLLATFVFTVWMGKLLGVDRKLAQLIAAGTSICGASAVIATNTVTNAHDEDVAYAVACVTVFGSVAMFTYPLLPGLLHLDPHAFGLWTGASIHEIAQVVAAAFQDGQKAGEFGTIAKLSRVMLLAPVVIALGLIATRSAGKNAPAAGAVVGPAADAMVRARLCGAGRRQQPDTHSRRGKSLGRGGDHVPAVGCAGGDGAGDRHPQADSQRLSACPARRSRLPFHRRLQPDVDQIDRVTAMTLEQLRIFVAVAEKQHVTQAASELNLTQSATSAAIAALETRYGVKLFDRIGRGIALTQTGRDFLVEARAVLARARAAAQVLSDLAGLEARFIDHRRQPDRRELLAAAPHPGLSHGPSRHRSSHRHCEYRTGRARRP